jgi:hypothetical protein
MTNRRTARTGELPMRRTSVRDPFDTDGPPELCVWKIAPRTFCFATRVPAYSRKLAARSDTRRVEVTGVNFYYRTYAMRGNWRKVKRIVARYTLRTGDRISGAALRQDAPEIARSIKTAGREGSAQ